MGHILEDSIVKVLIHVFFHPSTKTALSVLWAWHCAGSWGCKDEFDVNCFYQVCCQLPTGHCRAGWDPTALLKELAVSKRRRDALVGKVKVIRG